jgi:predicted membrane channel-forming protein YqfA (hemolysin III family)
MNNRKLLPQLLTLIGSIPFLYFIFTKKEPNWIYYASLILIFAGVVYSMVVDWQQGNKKKVYSRLLFYGAFILLALLLGIFTAKR